MATSVTLRTGPLILPRSFGRLGRMLRQRRGWTTAVAQPIPGPGRLPRYHLDFEPGPPIGLCVIQCDQQGQLLAELTPAAASPVRLRFDSRDRDTQVFIPPATRALLWQSTAASSRPPGLRLGAIGATATFGYLLRGRWRRFLSSVRWLQALRLIGSGRRTFEARFEPDEEIEHLGDGQWMATGSDPRGWLRFERDRLPLGLCSVEFQIDAEAAIIDSTFYFDDGRGFRETLAHRVTGASGDRIRATLFIPLTTRSMRWDPVSEPGRFRIVHGSFRQQGFAATVVHALRSRTASAPTAFGRFLPRALRDRLARIPALARPETLAYRAYLEQAEPRIDEEREAIEAQQSSWTQRPTISIVMPTWNTPPPLLDRAIESVCAQTWPLWELCIADDASTDSRTRLRLRDWAARDARVRIVECERNGGISAASNAALALASGEFVGFLDHDDELHPLALYYVVEALNRGPELDLIYTDEDKIDAEGNRFDPHFKPDWNPELLESQNYLAHFCVYRRTLVDALGGLRSECDGSQDYDLALRASAASQPARIHHVPVVLYHWRAIPGSTALATDAKSYPHQAGLRALADRHTGHPGTSIRSGALPTSYRVDAPLPQPPPLASIIIPTRDGGAHLRTCLDSLCERTRYPAFEVLLVDNQSCDPDTLTLFEQRRSDSRFRVLPYDAPFNYSAINNAAAREARGRVVVLLNDDTEVISPDWLDELVRLAIQPDIGAVGALLFYPDGMVQHGGVALGIGGVAGHLHLHAPRNADGYMGRLKLRQAVSAVTGACLAVEAGKFQAVGGLDEVNLPIAFNDVDLCIRLAERGWRSVWTPWTQMYHHESKTRGLDTAPEKRDRFDREARYMKQRWGRKLRDDPYYSPHFSRVGPSHTLADPPFQFRPWTRFERREAAP